MIDPRTLLSRIASLFRRRALDRDLDEELSTHIELAIEENLAKGMTASQARTQALRDFGGLTQTRETYRNRRGLPLLDQLGRDLHYGLRQLYRSPGFAATAILTLALGLGANTAIFSIVNALLLRPLAVPHAEELIVLSEQSDDFSASNLNEPIVRALEKHTELFEALAASNQNDFQILGPSGNQRVPGAMVSGQFFSTFEVHPLQGRYLTPSDDVAKGSPSGFAAVISNSFWHTWFNGAPDVIGRTLIIANTPFTIVGIMPEKFFGSDPTRRPQIFVPLSAEPIVDAPYDMIASGFHANWLEVIARRPANMSLEQVNAALRADTLSIFEAAQADAGKLKEVRDSHLHFVAEPGSKGYTYFRELFRKPLIVVFALCGAVLLLACLNLASLLMARAAARERELATRLAIGASRIRLIQQLLVETFLIAILGTATGLLVSPLVSHSLASLLLSKGREVDLVLDTSLDFRVFAFAALITLVATLAIGLIPALRATSGDLNDHMKNGAQTRSHRDRRRLLPKVLLGSEVALALLLVIGAGLLASSLTRLYHTGLGFEPHGIYDLELSMDKQPLEGDALHRWYQQFAEALAHQPGVQSVSFESDTPLSGSTWTDTLHTPQTHGGKEIYMNAVAPQYFSTMHIPLLSGRDFRWQDTSTSGHKIILNESAARLLFPNQNPIGQAVLDEEFKSNEVIAVVGDVKYQSIRDAAPAGAYLAIPQSEGKKTSYTVVVRATGSPAPLAAAARTLVARMAPQIPPPIMMSMSSTLDASISSERMMAMLSVFFALCALLVTAIGLYGTLAYATARRTSEIGIRMALGAQRLQVVLLVFRENAWTASVGSIAGLAISLLGANALTSFLYGTSIHDPWVLIGSVASLAMIASAASLLPAIRAARIDPIQALRSE